MTLATARNDDRTATPEQALWTSILMLILSDALTPARGVAAERDRAEALAWLASRSKKKDQLLQLAGIDPDWFWERWQNGKIKLPERNQK